MKYFVILFAIVAVASAGYHHAEYIHITEGPDIPGPKASPLALHGDEKTTKIHYADSDIGHPKLVGVEHYKPAPVYEPGFVNVAVHGGEKGYY